MTFRSFPSPKQARTDLLAYAEEICDWGTEIYRDELASTLILAASRLEQAERLARTDAPYAFWLGGDAA